MTSFSLALALCLVALFFHGATASGNCEITPPGEKATQWTVQNVNLPTGHPNLGKVRTLPRAVQKGDYCLGDNPSTFCDPGRNGFGNCVSKDIKLAQAQYVSGPKSCEIGKTVTLTFAVQWIATSFERYDVSVYVAMDGGNAMTGSCYGAILHRPSGANAWPNDRCGGANPTDLCLGGAPNQIGTGTQPSTSNGPYLEVSTPLDQCHDLSQGQLTWQTLDDVPFICRDADANGQADISACLGWLNNKNEASCNGIDRAIVKAGSKCNCETTINIQGLVVCSAQQTLCYGSNGALNSAPCEPTFSARFKVSTGPVATYLPASSTLYGNIYLDFQDTNQRMALQYFDPQATGTIITDTHLRNVAQTSYTDQVIREDILWPCKSLQKVKCGSGCNTLFTTNWIPRFFREGPYPIDTAGSKLSPDTVTGITCPTLPAAVLATGTLGNFAGTNADCVKKFNIPNSPATAVDYLWFAGTEPTAALQRDGTIWQFFKTGTVTASLACDPATPPYARGATLSFAPTVATREGPINLPCTAAGTADTVYDWAKFDGLAGCSTTQPVCQSNTEVAFVIDAQNSITLSEWRANWLPYVWRTVAGFDPANTQTQFGFCFSADEQSTTPVCQVDGTLISDRSSICQTYLEVGTNSVPCGSTSTRGKASGGSTDFRAMINKALSTYFKLASAKPRRLVVLVGGPDAPVSAPTWESVWATANAAGVQIHAVGIGSGSFDSDLLRNIVGTTGGTFAQWSDSSLLAGDNYLYRRLCPGSTPVCGCNGFCECAGGVALCPASCTQTSNCGQSACSAANPCAGCVLQAGATKQCPDLCYSCNELDGGNCNILKECPEPNSGKDTKCTDWACATINGVAQCVGTPKPASFCNDGNGCTADSCVPGTGCVYNDRSSQICNDQNECTDDLCINNAGTAVCQYTPINVQNVCGDNNVCTTDSCVKGQGCLNQPIPCDDSNPCTVSVCDSVSGCSHTQKNCDDSNVCTTDSCDGNGNCVNAPIANCVCAAACAGKVAANGCQTVTCINTLAECTLTAPKEWVGGAPTEAACQGAFPAPGVFCDVVDLTKSICTTPNDLCYTYTCNGATTPGTCTKTAIATCDDGSACTKDYCDGATGCKNDPLVDCTPLVNACTTAACNSVTGRCETTQVNSGACLGCASNDAAAACKNTADLCQPVACVDNCANAPAAQQAQCAIDLAANGFYCATFPVECIPDTTCTTYSCVPATGKCTSTRSGTAAGCDALSTGCSPQRCVDGVGCLAQTASNPCTGAELADKCAATKCEARTVGTQFPNGYECVADTGTRDCADYSCSASATATEPAFVEYVISAAAAAQWELDFAGRSPQCVALACTIDTCDSAQGCVNSVLACSIAEGTCNVTLGCFEANNKFNFPAGVCQLQVDQSLVDFCGICFGDYASCFFQTVIPVSTVAGIAGGVVAGIVIASIIAALLIFWLTKKGYDYYQMQSQLNAVGLTENPTFQANTAAQGVIPD